jgi:flagellar biosynthesis/type III secretory pathway protein FliH
MGEVIFIVPKKKRKMKLIKSKQLIDKMVAAREEHLKNIFDFNNDEEDNFEAQRIAMQLEKEELQELISTYEEEKEVEIHIPNIEGNIVEFFEEGELIPAEIKDTSKQEIEGQDIPIFDEELANEPDMDIGAPPERNIPIQKVIYTEIYTVSEHKDPIKPIHNIEEKKDVVELELVEKYIQEAYNRGFADCKEIGIIDANNKIAESHKWIRRIEKLMQKLREHFGQQLAEFKEKLLDLSMTIAETVINTEVVRDKNIVIKQIEKVFNELDEDVVFNISVSPDELKYLKEVKSTVIVNSKELINTIFIPDGTIKPGGCIFKTSSGMIDANITTQLKFIREELEAIRKEEKLNFDSVEMNKIPEVKAPIDVSELGLKTTKEDNTSIENNPSVEKDPSTDK